MRIHFGRRKGHSWIISTVLTIYDKIFSIFLCRIPIPGHPVVVGNGLSLLTYERFNQRSKPSNTLKVF